LAFLKKRAKRNSLSGKNTYWAMFLLFSFTMPCQQAFNSVLKTEEIIELTGKKMG
jgi:hypothetical protein